MGGGRGALLSTLYCEKAMCPVSVCLCPLWCAVLWIGLFVSVGLAVEPGSLAHSTEIFCKYKHYVIGLGLPSYFLGHEQMKATTWV